MDSFARNRFINYVFHSAAPPRCLFSVLSAVKRPLNRREIQESSQRTAEEYDLNYFLKLMSNSF